MDWNYRTWPRSGNASTEPLDMVSEKCKKQHPLTEVPRTHITVQAFDEVYLQLNRSIKVR